MDSALNGFRFPSSMAALKLLLSRITDGRKNFSCNSADHCFLRFEGQMISSRRLRSAQFCDRMIPASMVFPSPTSSARMAPFERGDLKAKAAASTWCGVKSTCASCNDAVNLFKSLAGKRLVSQLARNFAC